MDQEKNIESIRSLEKQIREGKGDTIKLKRARNSLLNISVRVPPEILGYIFTWIVARERDYSVYTEAGFDGLKSGSYSFLLVCHHWSKVASRTPELWAFWGNTLHDWRKRCHRARAVPVDLVLEAYTITGPQVLCAPLRDALRDRATRDKIRQIHLRSDDTDLLASILSPLMEGTTEKSIESIVLETANPPELSQFFARSFLPRLQCFHLSGALPTPVWDHLALQTARLTVLSLQLTWESDCPTMSQLLAILISNPNLQELNLADAALPEEADWSGARVPLHCLKTIDLIGEFDGVFGLLKWLELPATLGYLNIKTYHFSADDILRTAGPYLQGHFQRDLRFQDRSEVFISNPDRRRFEIIVCRDTNDPGSVHQPRRVSPYVRFSSVASGPPPPDPVMKNFLREFMAFIPRKHVVSLKTSYCLGLPEELFIAMPNIETLSLSGHTLSEGFLQPNPDGPYANTKLLPSLRSLYLGINAVEKSGWEPLVSYLAHQTSGNHAISFHQYRGFRHMPWEVVAQVQDLVGEFDGPGYGW